jgi:EAL domain-containing protein (putative c-di-GMP-specific phosphodiesterase class I)/GGDEF domain-containing protein
MSNFLIALANAVPLFSIAKHPNETLIFSSFLAGILLVSWFLYIIQLNNTVLRLSNTLLGVCALALLSTHSVIPLIGCGIILLILSTICVQKKYTPITFWLCFLTLALYSLLSVFYVLQITSFLWPIFAIAVYFIFANLIFFAKLQTSLNLASNTVNRVSPTDDQKLLLLERSVFLNGYDNWRNTSEKRVVVLFKLEGLNQLNRMVGRDFGDLLIAKLGKTINDKLAHQDVMSLSLYQQNVNLCYLGGVDFVFAVDTSSETYLHQKLIQKIYDIVHQPMNIDSIDSELSLKVAIVEDKDHQQAQQLIAQAYLSVEYINPQQWLITFNEDIAKQAQQRKNLLADLSSIDFERDFELYFHPVIDISSNQIVFVELLLRWRHPKLGKIDAEEFIEEVSATGLMLPIAHWLLEKAAQLVLSIKQQGIEVPVSINLFGKELLQDEFIDHFASVLSSYSLNNGDIVIESPAHVFMSLPDQGEAILRRLKEKNIAVCLDHLGFEPLQLSKLPRLMLNYVKVDGFIVQELGENVNTRSLLSGIIEMSNSLGINVICAGTDSLTQLEYISKLKCHAAQGYLFSRPILAEGLASWLTQWNKKLASNERPF